MAKEISFSPLIRENVKARVGVFGPGGSGKSYTAILIATHLASDPSKVFIIDTENGRAKLYAEQFGGKNGPPVGYEMDPPYHPTHYINAMRRAAEAGAEAIVLDSITPEWDGQGGVKEIVDAAKGRFGGNTHSAWSVGTPLHNQFVEEILASPCHVIATMKSKTDWVIEQSDGKSKPKKVGLAPMQRDTIEYEFDLMLLMDSENAATVTKTHAGDVFPQGRVIERPGKEFAEELKTWLGLGVTPTATPAESPVVTPQSSPTVSPPDPPNDPPPVETSSEKTAAPVEGKLVTAETLDKIIVATDQMQQDFGDHDSGRPWSDHLMAVTREKFGRTLTELSETEAKSVLRGLETARNKKLQAATPA